MNEDSLFSKDSLFPCHSMLVQWGFKYYILEVMLSPVIMARDDRGITWRALRGLCLSIIALVNHNSGS